MPGSQFSPPTRRPAATPASSPAARDAAPARPASGPGTPRFASALPASPFSAPPASVELALREPGVPLADPDRARMEARLGHDLGGVRIHTGAKAAASARSLEAHAYSIGQHIVFDAGRFAPGSRDGDPLLAHELVHTVQQRGAASPSPAWRVSTRNDASEVEAAQMARGPSRRDALRSPVRPAPTGLHLAREAWGFTGTPARQKLFLAKLYLQAIWDGRALLNTLVEQEVAVELRGPGGAAERFRFRNPLVKTDAHTRVRDGNQWEIDADSGALPKGGVIVLDASVGSGDLALALFRQTQQAQWARNDPAALRENVRIADDRVQGRAQYSRDMVENIAARNFQQIQLKRALKDQGATVDAKLPFEAEYDAEYNQAFASELGRTGAPGKASSAATSAGYKAIQRRLEGGQVLTHTGEKYGDYFAREWDAKRDEWAAKNPGTAREKERRHITDQTIKGLVEIIKKTDPKSPAADNVIQLIRLFVAVHNDAEKIIFVGNAGNALDRLLSPFGFRFVQGSGIQVLQRKRLEYALANHLRLTAAQRADVRKDPYAAVVLGIKTEATEAELEAQDQIVGIRELPHGGYHTGTLAEFRAASEADEINHILGQLESIRQAGPGALVGRIVGGERGAEIGAVVDTGLMFVAPLQARRNIRRQMKAPERGAPARLEPEAIRAPAPERTPVPRPDQPVQLEKPAPAPTPTATTPKAPAPPPTPTPAPVPAPAPAVRPNSPARQPAPPMAEAEIGMPASGSRGGPRSTYASRKPAFQQLHQQLMPVVAQINPFGGRKNCVPVTIAMDQAIATGKASPAPVRYAQTGRADERTPRGSVSVETLVERSSTRADLEAYTGTANRRHGALALFDVMRKAPDGTRAILTVYGDTINHATNVVKLNGVILAIDAQVQTIRPYDDMAREMQKNGTDWRMIWYRMN